MGEMNQGIDSPALAVSWQKGWVRYEAGGLGKYEHRFVGVSDRDDVANEISGCIGGACMELCLFLCISRFPMFAGEIWKDGVDGGASGEASELEVGRRRRVGEERCVTVRLAWEDLIRRDAFRTSREEMSRFSRGKQQDCSILPFTPSSSQKLEPALPLAVSNVTPSVRLAGELGRGFRLPKETFIGIANSLASGRRLGQDAEGSRCVVLVEMGR